MRDFLIILHVLAATMQSKDACTIQGIMIAAKMSCTTSLEYHGTPFEYCTCTCTVHVHVHVCMSTACAIMHRLQLKIFLKS